MQVWVSESRSLCSFSWALLLEQFGLSESDNSEPNLQVLLHLRIHPTSEKQILMPPVVTRRLPQMETFQWTGMAQ